MLVSSALSSLERHDEMFMLYFPQSRRRWLETTLVSGKSWLSQSSVSHTLILGPIEAAFSKDEIIVISIDALDECEDQEGTEMFLKTIMDCIPDVPFRFVVTSRPERRIREAFKQRKFSLRLHDIEDQCCAG